MEQTVITHRNILSGANPTKHMHEHEAQRVSVHLYLHTQLGNPINRWRQEEHGRLIACVQTDKLKREGVAETIEHTIDQNETAS
jgi:hypothetical protein